MNQNNGHSEDILEYFSIFFGNCGDSIQLIRAKDFKIIDVNAKTLELYDIPPESKSSLIGKCYKDFKTSELSSLSPDEENNIIEQIKANGKWSKIIQTSTVSGRHFMGEITLSLINFKEESYFVVRTNDVTEQVNLNDKLIEQEKGFRSIINQLPRGVIIHDNGQIKYANPYFLNLINKKLDEVIGKHLCDFVESNCFPILKEQVKKVRKGQSSGIEQINVLTKEGLTPYSIQTFKDDISGDNSLISLLSNLEIYKKFSAANLRADLAEETNIRLQKEIKKHQDTQQRLSTAQTFTENIINSSIDMVMAVDNKGKILTISPSALFRFGYDINEMMSLDPAVLYEDKNDYNRVADHINKYGEFIGEVNNITKNGRVFTSFLSATHIKDNNGNVVGIMGISRDITELQNTEKELIKSEKKYKELFDNLSDAVLVLDKNNDFEDYNKAAIDLFELDTNKKYNIEDFLPEDTKRRIEVKRKELRKDGKVSNFEIDIITAKGHSKVVEISSNAFFKNGLYNGSRDIVRDVSERRKYQIDLTNKQYQLQSIFENSSNFLIWTLSENFELISINKELQELMKYGFNRKIEIGIDFIEFIKPGIKPHLFNKTLELYKRAVNGTPQEFEAPLMTLKGEEIWIETFLSPIKVVGKNKYDLACLAIDITDKKKAEQELLDSLNEKEILLKEVHHRVKNNLQVISSILNLQSSYVKDENTLSILRESQNRIKSMSFIHESLYQTKDFSEVNFSAYLENLVRNLVQSYQIENNNIILNLEIGEVSLNLDQSIPCGLIVNELVSNAIKYAYLPNEKGILNVKLIEEKRKITIIVEDKGKGLPEGFSIQETQTLGLQLVDSLVNQIDGEIKIESKKGTKYTISFVKN